MIFARRAVSALLTSAIVVACGNADFPSDPTIADRICTSLCKRHHSCQPGKWDEAECRSGCLAHGETWHTYGGRDRMYWRDDYVKAIVHCTEEASCDVVENEPQYRGQCWADARPPPSYFAIHSCTLLRRKITECGGKALRTTCDTELGTYSDAVLGELANCLDEPGCRGSTQCWNDFAETTRE